MITKVNWRELLDRSSFRDVAECVEQTLETRKVHTWARFENIPKLVGTSICGRSTHVLIQELFNLKDNTGEIVAGETTSSEMPEIGDIVMKSKPKRRNGRPDEDVETEYVTTDDGE